jgi:ATP-binding cassette subfamily B multidrug efflux pump
MLKHQALAGNFPMRLRWNFHRLMLGQSMGFYQDEFAGRIATKVMQTALAVRDTLDDLGRHPGVRAHLLRHHGGGGGRLRPAAGCCPSGWLVLYVLALRYFVPRLGKVAQDQADARSLMTGRITDAYTNIATVKLFSHSQREAGHARARCRSSWARCYRQMRLVSGFEVVNQALSWCC